MSEVSALGPVDPASLQDAGQEKAAPWIVRKLVGVRHVVYLPSSQAYSHGMVGLVYDRTHRHIVLGDSESV